VPVRARESVRHRPNLTAATAGRRSAPVQLEAPHWHTRNGKLHHYVIIISMFFFFQSVHSSKRPCNALHTIERQAAGLSASTVVRNIYVYYFKYAELFFCTSLEFKLVEYVHSACACIISYIQSHFFLKKMPAKAGPGLGTSVSGYMRAYDRFCFLLSCPSEESTVRCEKRNGVSSAHFAPYLILRDTTQLIRMPKCKPGLFSALRITGA
jgi:hypothetical protein